MIQDQLKGLSNYTVSNIIQRVMERVGQWQFPDPSGCPWYRGQGTGSPLLPSILRDEYDEYSLTTAFKNRATALGQVPEADRLDQWLFLMQHYGAPTRLLDWTESPLLALYFALDSYAELCHCRKPHETPTIWAIHPYELNRLSKIEGFPNWTTTKITKTGKKGRANSGLERFRLAFYPKHQWKKEINPSMAKLPIAVHSTYLDIRIHSQKSCFTIHGVENRDFESLLGRTRFVKEGFLLKFLVPGDSVERLLSELTRMGVSHTTVFPDLEHLGKELKRRFALKHTKPVE